MEVDGGRGEVEAAVVVGHLARPLHVFTLSQ